METKRPQGGLLVLKSTTAFNSFVIFIMAIVVLYNHQRVNEIESHLNSCRSSVEILKKNVRSFYRSAGFSSSIRLKRKARQAVRKILSTGTKTPTKPLPKTISKKTQMRKADSSRELRLGKKYATDKQKTNSTDHCEICCRGYFQYGNQETKVILLYYIMLYCVIEDID